MISVCIVASLVCVLAVCLRTEETLVEVMVSGCVGWQELDRCGC